MTWGLKSGTTNVIEQEIQKALYKNAYGYIYSQKSTNFPKQQIFIFKQKVHNHTQSNQNKMFDYMTVKWYS